MKGYYVERRFGWDTHGVPIEYEIDKKLGMSGLQAVEKIGIEKYNEECRSIVMKFAGDWKVTIDRLGRWIDMEDKPYKVNQSSSGFCGTSRTIINLFFFLDHGSHVYGIRLVGLQAGTLTHLKAPLQIGC